MVSAAMLVTATTASSEQDRRSHEVLDYWCSSASGEHRLTLFGNGTIRLRERQGADPDLPFSMLLAELTRAEFDAFVARLETRAYDRVQATNPGGPSGEWVEQCRLSLDTTGDGPVEYRFSRVDSVPLDLGHHLRVAEELMDEVRERSRYSGFPKGYVPRIGDVLERVDGTRFRIERFTGDGKGLEISGIDEPLVLYIGIDDVTGEFARVAERHGRR